MKTIQRARDIPVGSTVSKLGEPDRYTLMDHKPAYDFGNQKRDRIEIDPDHRLLAVNVEFGLGSIIPADLELVWHS